MELSEIHTASPAKESISNTRTFMLHLLAFVLPLITLTYWLTAPHPWWASLLWTMPIWILVYVDNRAKVDKRQPNEDIPNWPFDVQVYLLFALQMANHILLGVVASKYSIRGWDAAIQTGAALIPVLVLTGTTAGYSGIVLGHELVHRRNPLEFNMGRMLLAFVLYEHFATEHVRGHHPRIGTREDPATARFGETHKDFVRRAIPAQFISAWKLEKIRVGGANIKWYDPRMLKHRVLQGVVFELAILAGYSLAFGWVALVFFVLQSRTAVLLLETVNYIEHWGLSRVGKKVMAVDSWDTDNGFTLYTLVGLSRHADHHAQASRPYHKLRYFGETAKMPAGYYGTLLLALLRNEEYMAYATAELKRKGLGPFRNDAVKPQPRSHIHPTLRSEEEPAAEPATAAALSA